MSRKSRRHDPPEPHRAPFDSEELVDERVTVHQLTGELHDTLEALISGCAFLAKGPVPAALLDPESDEFQALAAEMSASLTDDTDPVLDAEEVEELDENEALERENAALDAEIDALRDVFDDVTARTRALARSLIARVLDRDTRPVEQYYVP